MPAHVLPRLDRRTFLKTTAMGAAAFIYGATATAADAAPLRLALLSDTHIPADREPGARNYNACEHLVQMTPDVLAAKPDGLIVTGDAAQLIGEAEDYVVFLDLMRPISSVMPVYVGLGNHDNRDNFYATMGELPGQVQPVEENHVTLIEHPHVRILVLDSLFYVRQRGGLLGKGQRTWLREFLETHTDRPVVLMFHHTLGDGDNDLLDTEYFFQTLAPFPHVKALFHGHSHRWRLYERQGIAIINLPTTAHIWTPDQPIGWVDATFHATGMDLTLRAFAGNREEDGTTTSYAWDALGATAATA